ncbi:uncharacterized protein EHS24_004421 [Apiotrichum porosum]|uniref:Mediator complex subunit 9 n=1 Tax=Apiotrichum porosum TaxID=105984 RepID=A0A427Y534_9TREE|nr:uncharacterized protein EHS24_004421 [Apiotrichum porosum]RSH86190.1 hypothetical protein EHS24_004421 [Apiotrichum porosum]
MAAAQQPSGSIPIITTTAPATASGPAPAPAETAPALPQGTFSSILPAVEDVLQLIYGLAEGDAAATTDAIVAKAKEVNTQLANMKKAANDLPGGHLGVDGVVAVTRVLEEQIERKHAVLRAFGEMPTPTADGGPPEVTTASATATPAVHP